MPAPVDALRIPVLAAAVLGGPTGSRRAARWRAARRAERAARARTGAAGGRARTASSPLPVGHVDRLVAEPELERVDRAQAAGGRSAHTVSLPHRGHPRAAADPPQHRVAVGGAGRELRHAPALGGGRVDHARLRGGRQGPARARAGDRARLRRARRAAGRPRHGPLRPRAAARARLHRRLGRLRAGRARQRRRLRARRARGAWSASASRAAPRCWRAPRPATCTRPSIARTGSRSCSSARCSARSSARSCSARCCTGASSTATRSRCCGWRPARFMLVALVIVLFVRPDPKKIAELLHTHDGTARARPRRRCARSSAAPARSRRCWPARPRSR